MLKTQKINNLGSMNDYVVGGWVGVAGISLVLEEAWPSPL